MICTRSIEQENIKYVSADILLRK